MNDLGKRRFVLTAGAALAGLALPLRAQSPAQGRTPYLADMHSHYGMFLPRLFGLDLKKHMQDTGTMLLAWAIVDDQRWIGRSGGSLGQLSTPAEGELWSFFQKRLTERTAQLQGWGIPMARTAADVDAALAGAPHVLLATEAANFLEGDITRLATAHAAGVRHLQLVHYIQSPIGDHQTAEPRHGGLSAFGKQVVAECRRLGLVVDLAHGTPALVDAALDVSDAAMVWSHSWIRTQGGTWQDVGYIARSLSAAQARKIAGRGGAVGLWTVRVNRDPHYPVYGVRTFADEMMRMCDLIGPEHVAFGTDMEGAGPGPILSNYVDLREVADNLAQRGLSEAQLEGLFIGNYAAIVKRSIQAAS
jgi:membrane dipeptidase